jgi:hypothetical protein
MRGMRKPGYRFAHPGQQFDRLKRELDETYVGTANAGRPMLLEGGLDWKAMSLTPKDMDFLEAKHTAAREIALAFGVPPMLLGIPGDNTFANYAEANRVFFRQTVLPLAQRVGSGIAQWLSPQFGEAIRVTIDTDRIDAGRRPRSIVGPRLWRAVPDAERKARGGGLWPDRGRGPVGVGRATISPGVVPANAGTHTLRRFGLSEGVATSVFNHGRQWLWVPAFAGTAKIELLNAPTALRHRRTPAPALDAPRRASVDPPRRRALSAARRRSGRNVSHAEAAARGGGGRRLRRQDRGEPPLAGGIARGGGLSSRPRWHGGGWRKQNTARLSHVCPPAIRAAGNGWIAAGVAGAPARVSRNRWAMSMLATLACLTRQARP